MVAKCTFTVHFLKSRRLETDQREKRFLEEHNKFSRGIIKRLKLSLDTFAFVAGDSRPGDGFFPLTACFFSVGRGWERQDFSAGGGWRVTGGGLRVAGDGWRLRGSGWRVAGGGLKIYMKIKYYNKILLLIMI